MFIPPSVIVMVCYCMSVRQGMYPSLMDTLFTWLFHHFKSDLLNLKCSLTISCTLFMSESKPLIKYSEVVLLRPPLEPPESGLYSEYVLIVSGLNSEYVLIVSGLNSEYVLIVRPIYIDISYCGLKMDGVNSEYVLIVSGLRSKTLLQLPNCS